MTIDKQPRYQAATGKMAGRVCPYCRFPIKEGGAVVECGACHAVPHEECFRETDGCAVAGCAGGPSRAGGTAPVVEGVAPAPAPPPSPQVTMPQAAVPSAPPPPPPVRPAGRSNRAYGPALVGAVIVAAVLAGGALAYALGTSGSSGGTTTVAVRPGSSSTPSSSSTGGSTSPPVPSSSTPSPPTSTGGTSSQLPSAPTVTGQDPAGFNIGPGCSDDPQSPDQGCSDSPSTPNRDSEGQCPNGITIDAQTTTCDLAESVHGNYTSDGSVTGYSPKRGQNYTFTCQTGGPGTTGYTICQSMAGSAPLYLRWHR